jgi:phenylacetate-CoA ligase
MSRVEYFNKKAETLSQDELAKVQSERLSEIVHYVYLNNDNYTRMFDEHGVGPHDIQGVEDVRALPLLTKEHLRWTYPLGMCCITREQLREMHMSSGSTGTPVVMPYTDSDLDQWAECMARCLVMSGLRPGDAIQITPSFGLFNGGFGFYHGARKAGMFVIPTGAGNTPRQVRLMQDFKVRGLMGVVSYGLRIIEELEKNGQSLDDLKIGVFGAETFSDAMQVKLNRLLGIESFDIYGMTETGGVGTTGMDCPAHNGIHVWEDHYLLEVINPETGEPVEDGKEGELVFTALTRTALPVIRFRSGDISRVVGREKCSCGRTHTRIDRIQGRLDDMLIVKGVNFFPKQVEQVLMSIPGVKSNYQIIIEERDGVKDVRINVEAEEGVTGFMVEKKLKEALGFSPKGDVFKPGELPRQEGKAKRVFHEKG